MNPEFNYARPILNPELLGFSLLVSCFWFTAARCVTQALRVPLERRAETHERNNVLETIVLLRDRKTLSRYFDGQVSDVEPFNYFALSGSHR